MSSSIVPASQAPRDEVTAYLVGQGYTPEIVAWKYFDQDFNRDQNRGWVWLKDGRVSGFIGLLPFHIARGTGHDVQRIAAQWLCGWSVADFESHRGAGVRLFKRALQEGIHLVLGGNDNSLSLMERMASRTKHAADLEFRLFLRAGAILERVAQRVPAASLLARSPLKNLPLPGKSLLHKGLRTPLQIHEGVPEALAPLLDSTSSTNWSASYDLKYLQWHLGRCPILKSWTIIDIGEDAPAALSLWHPTSSPRVWRAILWGDSASSAARGVLNAGIAHVFSKGGSELSILTSPEDSGQCELLRSRGFAPAPTRRPLFVFDGPQPQVQLETLHGLSFLSADLAYRF